jgi:ferredoxin-thioredoxin reductase catalytic chain
MSDAQIEHESFGSFLAHAIRFFIGAGLMLLGGMLVITFWLLPVGVVLSLFGLAVLLSDDGIRDARSHQPATSTRRVSAAAYRRILTYLKRYQSKTGTSANPDREVRDDTIAGLARNLDRFGRPLCPCVHNADEEAHAGDGERWLCPCDEMRKCKYCHCLMFVTPDGLPITEYLPQDHAGRRMYGLVKDPAPERSG